MGFPVNPGCFLLIYIGYIDSCLQVLVPLTSKNKSYFGCYADLVKERKKVCFHLVSHFPIVSVDDVITKQDTYFFILKITYQMCMSPVTWCI